VVLLNSEKCFKTFNPALSNRIVQFFKNRGAYVIGGIPNNWRRLSPDWQNHIARYDRY